MGYRWRRGDLREEDFGLSGEITEADMGRRRDTRGLEERNSGADLQEGGPELTE